MKLRKRLNILIGICITIFIVLFIGIRQSRKTEAELASFEHPALKHPEVAGKRIVRRIELFEPKEAFNFSLTDMDKSTTRLSDFHGKLVLVGFIYTTCPDVCGLLTQHFKTIQRAFEDIINEDLVLVLITTDPEKDTPERTKAYTVGFQGRWHFLTGSEEELKEVWEQYKVFVEAKKSVDLVYHSYMVALIDRNEKIRFRYIGLVDPKEVIINDINKLLNEKGA